MSAGTGWPLRRRSGRPREPLTLRARLVLVTVGLTAVATIVIGFATVLVLNDYLVQRLDGQIRGFADRVRVNASQLTNIQVDAFEAPYTMVGVQIAGEGDGSGLTFVKYVNADHEAQQLTGEPLDALSRVPSEQQPFTVDLGSTFHEYRVTTTDLGQVRGQPVRLIVAMPLTDVVDVRTTLILVISLIAAIVTTAVGFLGWYLIRRETKPLMRVQQTASRVADTPLDKGEVDLSVRVPPSATDPRTEVGAVGAALNRMLDHIAAAIEAREESETRVRRFVADASHELRTPLASIRGYSELTLKHHHELADDVQYSLGRIDSESRRMSELVEELLLLARLDSGRKLDMELVDLSTIVIDAVSDAHVASTDHEFELDVPDDSLLVLGDYSRVHQIVTNLLANARIHTPAGTRVTATLTRVSDAGGRPMARLDIEDDGQGIPAEIVPTLFERFVRVDSSRARRVAQQGTGLGLAIVLALTEQFGGHVSVSSRPGRTVFTVELPLALDAEGRVITEPADSSAVLDPADLDADAFDTSKLDVGGSRER